MVLKANWHSGEPKLTKKNIPEKAKISMQNKTDWGGGGKTNTKTNKKKNKHKIRKTVKHDVEQCHSKQHLYLKHKNQKGKVRKKN